MTEVKIPINAPESLKKALEESERRKALTTAKKETTASKNHVIERRNPKTGLWEKAADTVNSTFKRDITVFDGTTTSATTTGTVSRSDGKNVKTCATSVVSGGKFKKDNELRVCRTLNFER